MTISVCIPTYNRTDVLKKAIESCLTQTLLPAEIIVGDDSTNGDTKIEIEKISISSPVAIKYCRNKPSLGQATNVNKLMALVSGELMVLLHDDDTLLPDALENLYTCFKTCPEIDIAFGKNYIMSDDGIINKQESEIMNSIFYRTQEYTGNKLSPLEAGFLQQLPNDGYMIKSHIAKKTGYRREAGDACDFDFGLRLGLQGPKMFFLNKYTACYRQSDNSISTNSKSDMALNSFRLLKALAVPEASLSLKKKWLKRTAPVAIAEATNRRHLKEALQLYFSKWHGGKIFSPGGLKRIMMILYSALVKPQKIDL